MLNRMARNAFIVMTVILTNYHPYYCTIYHMTMNLFYCFSELSSLSNLLGHELLKVVNHQCDILEDDLAFVNFLQQGTGLYLLQSLYVLAEQVCYICCS